MTGEDGHPRFSDDRLMAYALGLDDDPELRATAESDDAVRVRLEEVRGAVERVARQLDAAVSEPHEGYADPVAPRWGALRELFEPPRPRCRSVWRPLCGLGS